MKTKSPVKSARKGRPRAYDPEAALDAATAVFWRNGYEGTSLTDLTTAMGMNRPSLYAAFGNKEALFRRVMDRYARRGRALVGESESQPTARAFIEHLLRNLADHGTDRRGLTGCFLIQGAMNCSGTGASVRRAVAASRHANEAILRARFSRAIEESELPRGTDPDDLARYFAIVIHGMSIHAADGADRATLHRAVDVALRAWPTP